MKRWIQPTFDSPEKGFSPVKKARTSSRKTAHKSSASSTTQPPATSNNAKSLWLEIHKPMTLKDLVIHPKKVTELQQWFAKHLQGDNLLNENKYLLLAGPSGCGKTTTLRVLAKSENVNIVEWITPVDKTYDPSLRGDEQTYQSLLQIFEDFILRASRYPSLLMDSSTTRSKIILVKDYPNLFLRDATVFHEFLQKYSLRKSCPIVFVCSDEAISRKLFPDNVKKDRKIETITFNPVHSKAVVKALKRVVELEKVTNPILEMPTPAMLNNICNSSGGDLRSAILELYFSSANVVTPNESTAKNDPNHRKDEICDLFHGLGRVLYSKKEITSNGYNFVHNPDDIAEAFLSQPSNFANFLQENYVSRFPNIKSISAAADLISKTECSLNLESKNYESGKTEIILSGLTRGLMVLNENPVKSFAPFVKPKFYSCVERKDMVDKIVRLFPDIKHSPYDMLLDTLPLLKLTPHLLTSEQKDFLKSATFGSSQSVFRR